MVNNYEKLTFSMTSSWLLSPCSLLGFLIVADVNKKNRKVTGEEAEKGKHFHFPFFSPSSRSARFHVSVWHDM
jgi:hypothetical protein